MKTFNTLLVSLVAGFALPALADYSGSPGKVVDLRITQPTSDAYIQSRGGVTLDEGDGALKTYNWGGTVCNGKNLTEGEIASLLEALKARDNLVLVPSYKNGPGSYRCLVSFRITAAELPQ